VAIGLLATFAVAAGPAAAADLDCSDFSSQAEAQEYLLPGDPHRLDADSDGIACESNPCPCSSATGGGGSTGASAPPSPPKPPPYELSKAAARAEAKRLARRFVSRNPLVISMAFGGCHRIAPRRIDCALTARGQTPVDRTRCQLRISVRAKNRHPKAKLASSQCHTDSTLILTRAQAQQAMLPVASEVAGKRVGLKLSRLNELEFNGSAEWRNAGTTPSQAESCWLELAARLLPSREVQVRKIASDCEPAS
jgi:hypothetical protein